MESNDSPAIPDRGETSDIPGLLSEDVLKKYPVRTTHDDDTNTSVPALAFRNKGGGGDYAVVPKGLLTFLGFFMQCGV